MILNEELTANCVFVYWTPEHIATEARLCTCVACISSVPFSAGAVVVGYTLPMLTGWIADSCSGNRSTAVHDAGTHTLIDVDAPHAGSHGRCKHPPVSQCSPWYPSLQMHLW